MENISTDKAPEAIGPYSQAVAQGDLIFTSGQIALSAKTQKIVEGGIEDQTRQVITNLKAVLEKAGSSLDKALKVNVFLRNISDFPAVNSIYADHFRKRPARSTVEVSGLPKGALIEMDVVATR